MSCSVLNSSHLLGKKWAIPIIEEIALGKFEGFNKFAARIGDITSTRLSEQLKELETLGLIKKMPSDESNTTKYSVTEKGMDLHHLIGEIKTWNIKWGKVPETCLTTACTECQFLKKS